MKPTIKIEVLRGTPRFTDACRVAAASLAMVACANAAAAPTTSPVTSDTAPAEGQFFNRPAAVQTPAIEKLNKLLSSQSKPAEAVTFEQAQTLKFGTYPPIKTTVSVKGKTQTHWTLHPFDLVALSRQAVQEVYRTAGVKIDPGKVGAVMMTESSLVARTGWSANGKTPSFGLAQLEENTARSLGVKNPNDPIQSAIAVAKLLAEGMRFARSNSAVDERIAISLTYNTSTTLRKSLVAQHGAGLTIAHLPPATQTHVKNMAYGETRMALFAKLFDQHEKLMHTYKQAKKQATQPQDGIMKTAYTPTPAPSTQALVTSLNSEQANRIRLELNQAQLEKNGHLQAAPMTSKGLADMRLAVNDQVQRMGQINNPAALRATELTLPASITARISGEISAIAQSMVEKVNAAAASVRELLGIAQERKEKETPVFRLTPAPLTPELQAANQAARSSMGLALAQIQRVREQLQQYNDNSHQPRPT